MASGKVWALVFGGLLLTGCSSMSDIGLPSLGDEREEAAAPSASYTDIIVVADRPERTARELDRYTVFEDASCNNPSAQRDAFSAAVDRLKAKAGADGADMVRVLGTGSLRSRGMCSDDVFQLTGVAFIEAEAPTQTTTATSAPSTADSLTARLEELEALEDRGLISEEELEQLRSRVLDEAFE